MTGHTTMKRLLAQLDLLRTICYKSLTVQKSKELLRRWRKMTLLYAATFLVVLPVLCHDLTDSIYSVSFIHPASSRQKARDINDERVRIAEHFLSSPGILGSRRGEMNTVWSPADDIRDVDVAVTIVTVSRGGNATGGYKPRYLTQAVWRFISLLQEQPVSYSVALSICNVDGNPKAYTEAIRLGNIVRTFTRHNSTTRVISNDTFEKEKDDYTYCLRTTVALRRPRYVLLVEDDALPDTHMTAVLGQVLRTRLDRKYARGDHWDSDKSIAYVKFYHPGWLLGYGSFERNRLPSLLAIGAIFSSVILGVVRCVSPSLVKERDLYVTWTILAVYAMLVSAAVGRSNIVLWKRTFPPHLYSTVPAPSCCTQAVLYSASTALQVAGYLDGVKCRKHFGKDSALEQFVRETGKRAYFVEPNTFSHIGMYSTLTKVVIDTSYVDVS